MKRILLVLCVVPIVLLAANQSNMYYRGDMNGFGTTSLSFRDLGTDSWMVTILSDGDDNPSDFKIDNETDWAGSDWSVGGSISFGSYLTWYNPNGGNGYINETNGKYYSITISDVVSGNAAGFVQETSGSPITISSVSDNSGDGVPNTTITVSIALSGSKSSEENIYVRYSTDSFSSDTWSLATGSGTSYSATLTTSGSGTVVYYVMTTTLTSSGSGDLDNYPDLATLYFDNNSGSNYTYAYDQSLPVELSAFSAYSSSKGVKLVWTTDSEIENQGFSILRKSQDKDWGELATFTKFPELVGQGSTTEATEYYFIDTQVKEGGSYSYQLVDIDYQGKLTYHKDHIQSITYVNPGKSGKPDALKVVKLYPNPFNPTVTLTYDLAAMSDLYVSIYNLAGEQVWNHAKGSHPAGQNYTLTWNGNDLTNSPLPSGIYLVNIQAGTQIKSEKVTLLR